MVFKSEIRDSQKGKLLEKVNKHQYAKYLYKIRLEKIRHFKEQEIYFDFPVTALVAPNGGGKTTVLGAAALAYKNMRPGKFFSKSGKLDNSMANWTINYKLVDKSIKPKELIDKNAVFKDYRWRREGFLPRRVIYLGVTRTVPAVERSELSKCASNKFIYEDTDIKDIESRVILAVNKILGKDISKYQTISIDSKGKISLLSGENEENQTFSEFHFGAGESSIIKLVTEIEQAEDHSLVLIEEIENGLHPIATIRLVEYLIDVAEKKNIQTIFTTHSDHALLPLPDKAIWSSIDQKLTQGKLSIVALRELQYVEHIKLIIYVEDQFAKQWTEHILRQMNFDIASINVVYMGGDGNAVLFNKYNNANPEKKAPSICIIDGDSEQVESEEEQVFRLPGKEPEEFIFNVVKDNLVNIAVPLCYALGWNVNKQSELIAYIDQVSLTNREYHNLFAQLGIKLHMLSEEKVKTAFLNIWCAELMPNYLKDLEFLNIYK